MLGLLKSKEILGWFLEQRIALCSRSGMGSSASANACGFIFGHSTQLMSEPHDKRFCLARQPFGAGASHLVATRISK